MLSLQEKLRYRHQIQLKDFGVKTQERLKTAKVLVIGIGGLGCPVAQYLVGAGIGTIGLVDGDRVEESNLPRQILFSEADTGNNKAETAGQKLGLYNSNVAFSVYPYFLSVGNAASLISQYDVVMDCTDNFPARYLINDYCVWLHTPYIYASVSSWEGQVALFNHVDKKTANYRDLFPNPPGPCIHNCAESGVSGITTGMIGMMQVMQCLHFLMKNNKKLSDSLYHYNTFSMQSYSWPIKTSPDNPLRKTEDILHFLKQNETFYGSGNKKY